MIPPSPRVSRGLRLTVVVLAMLVVAWLGRRSLLVRAAAWLVVEDPLAPADVLVVSNSMAHAAAFEAALLYQQHTSACIVVMDWIHDPVIERIRGLGLPYLGSTGLISRILERSGVPASAITVLPDQIDGTTSEVSAIVAFAERQKVASVLVIAARSHTARMKWLLKRRLPDHVQVSLRSPGLDSFSVDRWWRQRDQSREVIDEYLRWFNAAVLRDLWEDRPRRQVQTSTSCATVSRPQESRVRR